VDQEERVREDEMNLIYRSGWFGGGTCFYPISMRMWVESRRDTNQISKKDRMRRRREKDDKMGYLLGGREMS
jgi:hypothetical protein